MAQSYPPVPKVVPVYGTFFNDLTKIAHFQKLRVAKIATFATELEKVSYLTGNEGMFQYSPNYVSRLRLGT